MHLEVVTDPGSGAFGAAGDSAEDEPAARGTGGLFDAEHRPRDRVFALATPEAAVIATTALAHRGAVEGCGHGTGWYLRRLGAHLLTRLVDRPERRVADCLSDAIAETAALHGGRCDLALHGTPTASVVAVRLTGDRLDHLVLGPGAVLIRRDTSVRAIRDPAGRAHAAGARPSAAADAATGSSPCRDVHTLVLLNGGAARSLPDMPWSDTVRMLEETGAHGLLAYIRAAELRAGSAHRPIGLVHLRPE
ncbi:hypothetical protein [Yinghuangia soli]|uniref:Protein phosphatase 2C domain-containing protein n=1 Tax=Yinghuangia soli TaxID=2908204 RepID=A0AA41Q3B9_9ACTN|nr:hypothetical protein [Yinghuangia soli]MCF2529971.1 hypothetical protein [Yinghuangia soli]